MTPMSCFLNTKIYARFVTVCLFVCLFVCFFFSVVDIKFCYSVYFNPRISPSSDLHWTMYDKF